MTKEKIEKNCQIEMNNAGNSVLLVKFSAKTGDINHFLLVIICYAKVSYIKKD